MLNLQDLLKRHEEESELIEKAQNKQMRAISSEQKRETKALERELKQINDKYDARRDKEKNKFQEQQSKVEEDYNRRAANEMHKELQADYAILQERSDLSELSVEELAQITQVKKILDTIPEEEKDKVESILNILNVSDKVKSGMKSLISGGINERDIYSYIALDTKKNKCLLLVPVDGNNNKSLSKSLEQKIVDILSLKSIVNARPNIGKGGTVEGCIRDEIKFDEDYDLVNGFLLYTVASEDSECNKKLFDGLLNKIKELQPAEFKDRKLTHRVMPVEAEIINYFASHVPGETYSGKNYLENCVRIGVGSLPISDAARILGYKEMIIKKLLTTGKLERGGEGGGFENTVMVGSLIKYIDEREAKSVKTERRIYTRKEKPEARTPNQDSEDAMTRRSEALGRLERIEGDKLDYEQAAEVLGYSNPGSLYSCAKEVERVEVGRYGKQYLIKESLRKFIMDYTPTSKGWSKKK